MDAVGQSAERVLDPNRPVRRRWTRQDAVVTYAMIRETSESHFGLVTAVWFGLAVGLLELALILVQKPLHDPSPGFFRMNRHIVWTVPIFDLALFSFVGLILTFVRKNRPHHSMRVPTIVLGWLATFILLLTCRRLHGVACAALACGISYRMAQRMKANQAGFRRLVRWTLPVMGIGFVVLIGISLGGHTFKEYQSSTSLPSPRADAPNVLLIVLDTVRADHLSSYGYMRDTTPNLTRFARRGITFKEARTTAPWTLPSHASMMTGRWPHQLSSRLHGPLDASEPTLAEALSANGYATGGFIANTAYCSAETGLARGFTHYEDHDLSPAGFLRTTSFGLRVVWQGLVYASEGFGGDLRAIPVKSAAKVNQQLLTWLDRQGRRPFFAFLNYADAHTPYRPPASFKRHFGLKPETRADITTLEDWFRLDKSKASHRDVQLASDAYDDCIAYIDEQIGILVEELDRRRVLQNTLVLVTSDHGELLGEHQLFGHASSLYDPEIHVPLLMILPEGRHARQTVTEPVSLRDLPATVTDIVGLGSGSSFPGRSLARYMRTNEEMVTEPLLTEVDGPATSTPNLGRSPAFQGPMKALTIGQEVYIRNANGIEEFYNVKTDPSQMRNLIRSPEVIARLELIRASLTLLTCDDTRPEEWRNSAGPRRQLGKTIVPGTLNR